jgi:hypothetical protein
MRTAFAKISTGVAVFVLTFGVLLNWVGDISTAHARAAAQGNSISVQPGTRVLVRLSETVNSASTRPGARFTGRLETNLMAQGVVVAPRGTTVHGRLVSVQSAGRMAGGAELALTLTDIVIGDTAHPVMTDTYLVQGHGQGGRTARSVAGGAGLGSVIGAFAGGGRGAAIGAAAGGGLGTARAAGGGGGQQLSLTGGTLLEFRLQQPASLPKIV